MNNWLGLTLAGNKGPASAIGAKVTLYTENNIHVKINQWANSYLSYNDPRILFGLGIETKVLKLQIRWPDGSEEFIENVDINQYITIVQGQGSN
jgi:hypothetical protein